MPEVIIGEPLTKFPHGATELSSRSNLLAAWRYAGLIHEKYHFVLRSHTLGWRGYRWPKQYGTPIEIFIASPDAVWAHTVYDLLIHLQIGQNGKATITSKSASRDLLDAYDNGCLVKELTQTIKCLNFSKDERKLSAFNLYTGVNLFWAYFLPDGAIAVYDTDRLIVLSPRGVTLHEERVRNCYNHPPFILRKDDAHHLYYTDDPRKGWCRSDALNVIRNQIGKDIAIKFFAMLDDNYYIAVNVAPHVLHLYRFSSGCPDHVKYMWGIDGFGWEANITLYSGLICINSPSGLFGYGNMDIPENNGLLVWDPITKTFHADIPRTTSIQKISTGRIPTINIPGIWDKNAQQR